MLKCGMDDMGWRALGRGGERGIWAAHLLWLVFGSSKYAVRQSE